MANTYAAPNFSIDTDIDLAGLTALKGSAPAATDVCYTSEGATTTLDGSCAMLRFYNNDNPSGTAVVKIGHTRFVATTVSITVTLYDTNTTSRGLYGAGTTAGSWTFQGASAGVRVNMVSNSNRLCSNLGKNQIPFYAEWTTFTAFVGIYSNNAVNTFNQLIFDNCQTGMVLASGYPLPAFCDNILFLGCELSWNINGTTATDLLNFLHGKTFLYQGVTRALSSSITQIGFGNAGPIARYGEYRFNAASFVAVPVWTITTGIQSLTANPNGTLSASWNAATHATGDQVKFRIYIRNGSAPDVFGLASPYYLHSVIGTVAIIGGDTAGALLEAGSTYYVIVRAATDLSVEDGNTTELHTEVVNNLAHVLEQLKIIKNNQVIQMGMS